MIRNAFFAALGDLSEFPYNSQLRTGANYQFQVIQTNGLAAASWTVMVKAVLLGVMVPTPGAAWSTGGRRRLVDEPGPGRKGHGGRNAPRRARHHADLPIHHRGLRYLEHGARRDRLE